MPKNDPVLKCLQNGVSILINPNLDILKQGHLINQFFDPVLSFKLWSRVEHVMPWSQSSMPVGLNEHLRFLRYSQADVSSCMVQLHSNEKTGFR